jgi:hypothetical protein
VSDRLRPGDKRPKALEDGNGVGPEEVSGPAPEDVGGPVAQASIAEDELPRWRGVNALVYGRWVASEVVDSKEWRAGAQRRFVFKTVLVISTLATAALVPLTATVWNGATTAWVAAGMAALVSVSSYVGIWTSAISAHRAYLDRQDDEAQQEARERLRNVPSAPMGARGGSRHRDEELRQRIAANDAVLKSYQDPVRRQARTSYTYAQAALAVGFITLVAGAVAVLAVADDATSQVAVGALTAIGSALSGYIAATYLRIYERAQTQQNFYFEEPLITSYLLTAERLAAQVTGERRKEVLAHMVEEIVAAARSNSQGLNIPARKD